MRCKKCGEENAELKRCCSSCGAFLEGYTLNNVTGEFGYRGGDGGWYKNKAEYMKTKNMKVYIAGKIGEEVISDATRRKFARAEEILRAKGYDVFNPCDEKWQATLRREYEELWPCSFLLQGKFPTFYDYVLLRDLTVLATKDAVYFLEDWDRSPGANSEHSFAMVTGKKMLWQRLEDAKVFRNDNETTEDVWLPIE